MVKLLADFVLNFERLSLDTQRRRVIWSFEIDVQ